jgi:hypothetical protein
VAEFLAAAPKGIEDMADAGSRGAREVEVIVGEIPAADDPTTMLWTVRCTLAEHDILGHYDTRSEAEEVRADHLRIHEEG